MTLKPIALIIKLGSVALPMVYVAVLFGLLFSGFSIGWGPTAPAVAGAAPAAPLTASINGSKFSVGMTGTVQSWTHTITNTGNLLETFNLTVTSRQTWTVSVTPAQVQIGAGASRVVTIQVTIPVTAQPGTTGLTVLTAINTPPNAPIVLQVRDTVLVQSGAELKIPTAQWGQLVGGERVYSLTEMNGTTNFFPNLQTPTSGYNGSFLGPTLIMTKGEVISLAVTNNLTEVTTTHWHGIHLPGKTDGGPHQEIQPGATWRPTFTLINPASTMWYHPHPHTHESTHQPNFSLLATTGNQVYAGLAGMIVARDSASNALGLPMTYGTDDFPIVVQDRNFNADGTFRPYPVIQDRDLHKGDYFLVNGTLAGNLSVPAQMVRFRLLNGSNARFYNVGLSDNRNFYQIASDNALLNQAVTRNRVVFGSGERIEIVVDLSGLQGQTLHFVNYASEFTPADVAPTSVDDYDQSNYILFSIQVTAPTANPVTTLPATLNNIVRLSATQAVTTRTLTLNIPPSINNAIFDMDVINITTTLGTHEVWSIVNLSEETHPFHIHDTPFQILTRNGTPPAAYEMGWKDTVLVHAGEQVNVIKPITEYADPFGPFMYHCHILDHEDHGMMGQYVILEPIYLPFVKK